MNKEERLAKVIEAIGYDDSDKCYIDKAVDICNESDELQEIEMQEAIDYSNDTVINRQQEKDNLILKYIALQLIEELTAVGALEPITIIEQITNVIDPSKLLMIEDGSCDVDALNELGYVENIDYILYRAGSNPPHFIVKKGV